MRGWVWLWLLAGCDRVLGLGPITPATVVAPGPTTIAAGYGHTCWIRDDGTLWCWGSNQDGQLGLSTDLTENTAIAQVGTATWTAISANDGTTCGLQTDASLWCWGDNFNGQLGLGDTRHRNAPVQLAGKWTAVSAAGNHTCAIDSSAQLWCWGKNGNGQLGDGTTVDETTPVMVATGMLAVAVGGFHTCALRTDHSLACWGLNANGQLGDGTNDSSSTPVDIAGSWAQITAGAYHTCALTRDGLLRCWGGGYAGQLGTTTTADQDTPGSVLLAGADASDWIGVTASARHTCAWNASQAYCFGDSSRGELGVDGTAINATPLAFPGGPWSALEVGLHHTCGIDTAGGVWCVGSNGWGQLGTGADTSQLAPELVNTDQKWNVANVGHQATCVKDMGGQSACGGDNFQGELGTGDRTSVQVLPVIGATSWNELSVGDNYVCGRDYADHLFCWGANDSGQLGLGATSSTVTTPQQLSLAPGTTASALVASDHTCGQDGLTHLYCWGTNDHGQLALPASTTPVTAPGAKILANGTDVWLSIGVGEGFTCGVLQVDSSGSGPVYCWGKNNLGQLGNGGTTDTSTPTAIATATTFQHVYVGPQHACATDSTGVAWCWGQNAFGEIGNGATGTQPMPARIPGQWEQGKPEWRMTLGYYHTCALTKSTLLLYCWGDNRRGQLGTNAATRQEVITPAPVGTDTWNSISAGWFHTCGVRNAQLYCWGSNDDGALLDGKAWVASLVQVPTP